MQKTVELTSYDVPKWLKDKINLMETIEEVEDFQQESLKDNEIWSACTSVLRAQDEETRRGVKLSAQAIANAERGNEAIEQMKRDGDWAL